MDRSFAMLGLTEDATKAQVQAAYERRLKKYKAADYADDPEYASRKIAELKRAYEAAYSRAGTAGAVADTSKADATDSYGHEFQGQREKQHKRHENREKRERYDPFEEEHRKMPKLPKMTSVPKFSEIKDKARDIKDSVTETVKDNVGGFSDSSSDSGSSGSAMRLDDSGTGTVTVPTTTSKKRDKASQQIGLVISLIIAVIGLFGMCEGDSTTEYEDFYTDDYVSEYNIEEQEVYDMAQKVNSFMYSRGEYGDFDGDKGYDVEELRKGLNTFTVNYAGRESFSDNVNYLMDNYDESISFFVDEHDNLEIQAEIVLDFYGFESLDFVQGFISPYTHEPINNMKEYIDFINGFYDEYYSIQL